MAELMKDVELRFNTNDMPSSGDFLWNFFTDHFVRVEMRTMYRARWQTEVVAAERVTALISICNDHYINSEGRDLEFCGELDDATYVYIQTSSSGRVWLYLAQTNWDTVASIRWEQKIKEIFPVAVPKDDRTIPVKFWMLGRNGAASLDRMVSVPSWDEIAENYAASTAEGLAGVMNGFKPSHGGQLVLWHGTPGTGKTFALRALGHHWKDWCTVECVVDPESFFGSASYMMQVLMDTEGEKEAPVSESGSSNELAVDGMWRLLVLEDAGELLAEDARVRTGQGLSRMLNLADGLIGQGLRTLVLVTTNEPLRTMHPAVARPGRCAAEVEFQKLSAEETKKWMAARDIDDPDAEGPLTLADLYGRADGFQGAKEQSSQVGFQKTS